MLLGNQQNHDIVAENSSITLENQVVPSDGFTFENIQEPEVPSNLEIRHFPATESSDEGDKSQGTTRNTSKYHLRPRTMRKAYFTALDETSSIVDYLWNYSPDSEYNEDEILRKCFRVYVKQALQEDNPFRDLSREAIRKELQQMVDLDVFTPVKFKEIPYNHRKKVISSLMFIKEKRKMDGTLEKIKARLAARGDQAPIGYDQIFSSPTANLITLYIVLAISVKYKCHMRTMDVPGAYLHAPLPENDVVYMTIPNDCEDVYCEILGIPKDDIVHTNGKIYVKLKKALYGLRQSSKLWYEVLKTDLLANGYKATDSDSCLFIKKDGDNFSIAVIYVDDIFVVSTKAEIIDELEQYLEKCYGRITVQKDKSLSFLALAIDINEDQTSISLNQDYYIEKLLEHVETDILMSKLEISEYPSSATLFVVNEESEKLASREHYLSIIMSLMFAAIRTRPDIVKEVTFLATRVSSPTMDDWNKLMKVLGYLKKRPRHKIVFHNKDVESVEIFADASHMVHDNTSGHTGIVGKIYGNTVFWKSHKQRIVVKSSTEAELVALDEAATFAIWIMELLDELGVPYQEPVLMYQDNRSTMTMAKSGKGQFKRTKHISNRYFWIKQFLDSGEIKLFYVPTDDMIADLMTKSMQGRKFEEMVKAISGSS